MKLLLSVLFWGLAPAWAAQPPFARGVNLTGVLQTASARQVQLTTATQRDLAEIRKLGFDLVRLPINLHAMTSGPPEHRIDPLLIFFLDQIADWAAREGLHLILDNHSPAPAAGTPPEIGQILVPVWRQLAAHFRDHPAGLYYEVLNEPHGIADALWGQIQEEVIAAIRAADPHHPIVVGPANWNSFRNLRSLPEYADDNLIYTFHFYEPFLFTHQGATWTQPSMLALAGVPFPHDLAPLPGLPSHLAGTWLQGALADYPAEGTVAKVRELLDLAAGFKAQRQVPLFCGELGVYIPNSDPGQRAFWYQTVRTRLEEQGIPWATWDYRGGFGLFAPGTAELFDHDLNLLLLRALGLAIPEQRELVLQPEREGFDIYRDLVGDQLFESSWIGPGYVDFWADEEPAAGRRCIHWTGVDRYQFIGLDLRPPRDLSLLVEEGFALELWVRGDTPGSAFDIRLIDTDTKDPQDHPWRMRATIDESRVAWDGQWHQLRIPLSAFAEHGAWEQEWFDPQGLFDWSAVGRIEIAAEYRALKGVHFWLDEIQVAPPAPTVVALEDLDARPGVFALEQNYPNPFNDGTAIPFALAGGSPVEVHVYNAAGQQVRLLSAGTLPAGAHQLWWDGKDQQGRAAASGLYLYTLTAGGFTAAKRMILLR
jgi:endoglucanase